MALADIIVRAAIQGVSLVIETQSSLLILALQAVIAEGRITPDRVSLNWFTRDATGQTHVAEAKINKMEATATGRRISAPSNLICRIAT